jgi:hypothetical protein
MSQLIQNLQKPYSICFVSYLKNKNKKENLLKVAQLNMAKKPQV